MRRHQKRSGRKAEQFGPRSELIADFLRRSGDLPAAGAVLDIGCGNGAFLRAITSSFPIGR